MVVCTCVFLTTITFPMPNLAVGSDKKGYQLSVLHLSRSRCRETVDPSMAITRTSTPVGDIQVSVAGPDDARLRGRRLARAASHGSGLRLSHYAVGCMYLE